MKKILPFILTLIGFSAAAQIPEDVLRYSFLPQTGTARSLAIGGAMGSLGGDISAAYVNPAGIGNYRTGEVAFTPGLLFNKNKFDFRGTNSNNSRNAFDLGILGVALGSTDAYNKKRSNSIALAISQTANFNNTYHYKGYNNYSSYAEQWAEQLSSSGQSLDQALNNPSFAYGTAPAIYTYLVDTFRINGNLQVKALPEFALTDGNALLQEKNIKSSGGIYELAFSYAANLDEKLLVGFTAGVPILNYKNTTTYTETDTSANTRNQFGSFTYIDDFSAKGAGFNLKIGIIYKPQEYIRLGAAIHSPSFYLSMKEQRTTNLTANTEDYNQTSSVSSLIFTNNLPGETKYMHLTPWRFLISGSYVIREIEDVRKQRGFITADIEYVHNKGGRFYSDNEVPSTEEINSFKALNQVIKGEYKGNFNFRLGGELKFNTIMARLGANYATNPYKDAALKANRLQLSGGLGYRHKGIFIDLTYVQSYIKDVDFSYRLQDKDNTFATVKTNRGNWVLGVGFKF